MINLQCNGDQQRDCWVRQAIARTIVQKDLEEWRSLHPADFTRVFREFHSGLLWPMVQEAIGESYTAGMIFLYTDKSYVLKHMGCYPIYSVSYHMQSFVNV